MRSGIKNIILVFFCCLLLVPLPVNCQEPIQLDAEQEDIALTDNIAIAKAQVEKFPDNPEAHFNLAIALSRTSLVEEAIKELRTTKMLMRKSENSNLIDHKINEYKKMLRDDPGANNIRYRLAFCHYLKAYFLAKKKKKELALKKQKEKTDKDSLNLLDSDKLYIETDDPEIKHSLATSIGYFQELLNKNPNDVWTKVYYGFILAEQFNDIEKARKLWLEAMQQYPTNPAPHFFIGELYIKEGNLKEGVAEIAKALLLRAQGF